MGWLIAAVGVLMAAAGGFGIATGAPIIQLERGWALVISGSVLLAAGFILLALAVVAQRLGRIARLLAAGPAGAAAFSSPDPLPALETEHDFVPDPEPFHPEQQPEPQSRQGLWKRVRGDGGRPGRDNGQGQRIAADLEPVLPVPVAMPRPITDRPEVGSAAVRPGAEAEVFAMRPTLSDPAPPTAARDSGLDHLFGTINHGAPAPDEGPGIVGRYHAGAATYVMYSDGTIAVESEGETVRRFGSMDELKRFIHDRDEAEAAGLSPG